MNAIYITEKSGDKVTGHYLSKKGSSRVVHTFTNCTIDWVKREASLVIDNPTVFAAKPAEGPAPDDSLKKILSETEDTLRELYSDILQRTSSVESSSKLRDDIWELASELRVLSSRFGGLKGGE
jgi:hypothetical protein